MKKKEVRKIDLKTIENPEFLKDLSYKELELLSADLRNYLVESVSKNGGHLSSNLGVVEATISLCRKFDFNKDKIIFDVGHQSYTYKILTGRSIDNLRTKEGVSGFQKLSESTYDHFECGHSSTSISAANGMAIARDLNKEDYEIVAFIGDGSIVNGLAMEGLNNAAASGHKIIIVLNDNDMSISKPVGGLAKSFRRFSTSRFYTKSKSFFRKIFPRWLTKFLSNIKNWIKRHVIAMNLFDNLGYKVIGPVDGHDLKSLDKAFEKAKKLDSSVVVHIKTIKGRGYKFAENDSKGIYHGVGKFDIETGEQLCSCSSSWSEFYGKELDKVMDENKDVVLIVPATENGSYLDEVLSKYPERAIDVGIAEEHAVTLSSALALSGKRPIVSMYSTFLQRAYDEVLHDVARLNAGVTFLVDRSGLVGADGDTHQGLYDEAFVINMPNTIMAMPSNTYQGSFLLKESFNHNLPFFIRYPKEGSKEGEEMELSFGKWPLRFKGNNKTAIVSVGPLTEDLLEMIKEKNVDVTLIQALFLKPMDEEMINVLLSYDKIIIYDAYATYNGFIQSLEVYLLEHHYKGEVIKLGVDNVFVSHASVEEQREMFNLRVEDVLKKI